MKELKIRRITELNLCPESKGIWLNKQKRITRNQHLQQLYVPKPNTEEAKNLLSTEEPSCG